MMNLTKIFSAAAIAVALPFAASAATLTVEDTLNGGIDVVSGFTGPASYNLTILDVDNNVSEYDVEIAFRSTGANSEGFTGETGPLSFNIINESLDLASFTIAVGTIRQLSIGGTYGFTGGVDKWFDAEPGGIVAYILGDEDNAQTFNFGESSQNGFLFSGTIAADSTATLVFDFDNVKCSGTTCPNIDFTVSTTPVPVPAAGFLLLGGLGGLAMMRRRKKS